MTTSSKQETDRRIKQMVQFIKQEANEKAEEIIVKAKEECNVEALKIIEKEKSKLRELYKKKSKQIQVEQKIQKQKTIDIYSKRLLKLRMQKREELAKMVSGKFKN